MADEPTEEINARSKASELETRLVLALGRDSEEILDDLVIEFKSNEASNINNEGLSAQLEYVVESVGEDEAESLVDSLIREWGARHQLDAVKERAKAQMNGRNHQDE